MKGPARITRIVLVAGAVGAAAAFGQSPESVAPPPTAAVPSPVPSVSAADLAQIKEKMRQAWRLNEAHQYAEAWRLIADLPAGEVDSPMHKLKMSTANWASKGAEAVELISAYLAQHPDDAQWQIRLSYALDRAGRGRDATQALQRYVELKGEDVKARKDLEYRLAQEAGPPPTGSPADVEIKMRRAWKLNEAHRYDEAWSLLAPLPRPEVDTPLYKLQMLTADWGKKGEEAVRLIEGYLAKHPDEAQWQLKLSYALDRAGRTKDATRALKRYVELNPKDAKARHDAEYRTAKESGKVGPEPGSARAGGESSRTGSDDPSRAQRSPQALRSVLRENPGDLTAARALGSLLEGKQRNTEALAVYLAVADARDRVPRDLMLRIARLQRKLGNRLEAIEWFQEALAEIWSSRQRTDLEIELAATQKEAGQFTDALASLAPVLEQENPPATAVLLAAGSATDSRQPALAVSYLDRLASIRLLTPSEEEWLAGQVRASGDRQRALLLYMRLASRPSPSAAVLEALGDVAEDGQDPSGALAALRRIEPGVRTPALLKKMMRVAIKAGNVEEAHGYLEAYRRAQPADAEVLLEHARLLAARQQNLAALESYQQFVNLRGTGNLSLELARAALAAKRYDLAAQWSRQAIQEGHNDRDTQVLLAESLYYGGRSKEANPLLRDLVTRAPEDARALELLAYTDIVLDRHLSAFRLLERAMRAQGTGIDRMLLQQGRSSFARGDHARSRSALERAHPEGEDVAGVAAGLADLDTAERPWLRLSASVFEDTNDIALDQAGAGVDFWPSSRGRVRVRARDGLLRQRALRFDRTAGAISYDQWFVKPELELAGTIGIENYSGAGDIVTGRVDARYYHQDRSESGARLRRESFYTVQDQGEQLPFSRVIDIGAIGPSFGHEEILAYHDKALPEDRRLRLELKGDAYDDGNHSAAIYTQYQIPLKPGSRNFTVIFPNLYAESFNRTVPGYFSPHAFVTGGVGFHAIRQNKDWNFELVLSPRAVSTNGVVDFGAHGFLALARRYRTFETGFEAFGVYDGTGRYTSARGLVHLSFRL